MGSPHGHKLHYHGHSWLHRLPAHVKLVALVVFMLAVVATPREWYPVFGVLPARCCSRSWRVSRVPPSYLAKRMVVEVPFVVFALLLPFVATGPAARGARPLGLRAGPARRLGAARQGHPRRAGQPAARGDHRAARPARRARAAARARSAGADHGLHDPLPRRRHRRALADARGPRVARLPRPRPAPVAGDRQVGRGAVHPLLRARRAGAPGDAVPGVRREAARTR